MARVDECQGCCKDLEKGETPGLILTRLPEEIDNPGTVRLYCEKCARRAVLIDDAGKPHRPYTMELRDSRFKEGETVRVRVGLRWVIATQNYATDSYRPDAIIEADVPVPEPVVVEGEVVQPDA